MSQSKIHTLVIYHANCTDGFGAAWAAQKFLSTNPERWCLYLPMKYGDIPDDSLINFDEIYIVDFSFPRQILTQLAKYNHKIVVLDHHKTAKEDLENWTDKPENIEIVFDMERSGAGITWDYFWGKKYYHSNESSARPALINYIEDYDLWKFKLPHSHEINARIKLAPHYFNYFSNLNDRLIYYPEKVLIEGEILLEQHAQHVRAIIETCTRDITINGIKGLVCNCNKAFSPEVGTELVKKCGTFGATYFHNSNDSVEFSLRSMNESFVDVSALAKTFGGGGHRNAAGFKLSQPQQDLGGVIIWSDVGVIQS